MNKKSFYHKLIYDIFQISLFTFVLFFILEMIKKGLITNYINFNYILIICLISGILSVLFEYYKESLKINRNIFALALSLFAIVAIYGFIKDLSGRLFLTISFIVFFSMIIITKFIIKQYDSRSKN